MPFVAVSCAVCSNVLQPKQWKMLDVWVKYPDIILHQTPLFPLLQFTDLLTCAALSEISISKGFVPVPLVRFSFKVTKVVVDSPPRSP